ncbi:MAG TPA: hypothetical protein VKZ85_14320 [Woeseiaceae bacterium]|nr:hypothetical protein [Woeseiaceae bacterium]
MSTTTDDARPVLEYQDTWTCIACGHELDGRAVTVQLHADCAVGLYNPPARSGSGRYCWTPYGEVAAEIWSPDGESIALVNASADARLRSLEADAKHRERVGADVADQEARRLRMTRPQTLVWAQRIVDALNAAEGRG